MPWALVILGGGFLLIGEVFFFFSITLGLKMSDTKVYAT